MNLFDRLKQDQINEVYDHGDYHAIDPGQVIFEEGDTATGLFVILTGSVEIFRVIKGKEEILATLGPNEVFGEMGLLLESGKRSASARTTEATTVFRMPGNPMALYKSQKDIIITATLLQNLICILGERLRGNAMRLIETKSPDSDFKPAHETAAGNVLNKVRDGLPISFAARGAATRVFEPGKHIFYQGEKATGFFFFESGQILVLDEPPGQKARVLAYLNAPTVAGEIGFFGDVPRSCSLVASTEVKATFFSARDFTRILQNDPRDALNVLLAAAQWTVLQIVEQSMTPHEREVEEHRGDIRMMIDSMARGDIGVPGDSGE